MSRQPPRPHGTPLDVHAERPRSRAPRPVPAPSTRRRRAGLLSVALTAAMLLTACSASDEGVFDEVSGAGTTSDGRGPAPEMDDMEMAEFEDTAADDSGEGGSFEPPAASDDGEATSTADPQAGRRIIRTAYLELEVADTAAAVDDIVDIVTAAGGFVAETDLQRDQEGVVRGSIRLRVPSPALFDTVEALDELAVAVPTRRIDERDVTAESIDLEASRRNLVAYEDELRALLGDLRDANSRAGDLLDVFERIREVRAEIDRIDARRSVLDDQVSLATIDVVLDTAASARPVADPTWSPGETVRDALTATARALTALADVAIRFALTVLPIALLVALPVAVPLGWWSRRRRARRAAPEPTVTPPPSGPAS
ncbi:MAG: DUF4349 domain-containing protein [Nitriliruptoraceae bacterium]|nr:DUF4349 domain-containing protein [Nitriliruptoraceae bacterium]